MTKLNMDGQERAKLLFNNECVRCTDILVWSTSDEDKGLCENCREEVAKIRWDKKHLS